MKELFEQQDREFEEKFAVKEITPTSEWELMLFDHIKTHISKIRQETLQAVKEEIEKYRVHIEREVVDPLIDTSKPKFGADEAVDSLREALDDLLKSLDI